MKSYSLLILVLFFTTYSFSQQPGVDVLVTNVSVVPMNSDTLLNNQDVLIKDGIIVSIRPSTKKKTEAKEIINGKGKYMLPNLGDAHVHFPKTEEEMERFLSLNLINGVTKLRSMRGDWKDIERRTKVNNESSVFPKLYLSPPPMHRTYDLTAEQLEGYVKNAKENHFDFIKVLSVRDEKLFKQLDSLCKKYNMGMAGHFPNNVSDSLIFHSNYRTIEHLGGLIGEPNTFTERVYQIKDKNIFICPTLQWYVIGSGMYSVDYMVNQYGMNYMEPKVVSDWAEKSTAYREKLGKQAFEEEVVNETKTINERLSVIKILNDKGIKLLLSPDSSSKFVVPGFGMMEEMKLYKKAGLTNYEILKTATVNFAYLFNENYGTIEVGRDADFMLVNDNPLEDLETLKNIEGLYFNKQFLNKENLTERAKSLEFKN